MFVCKLLSVTKGSMVGRPGFEPGIPWSLASELWFARPKPGIIAKLDHRPVRWCVLSTPVIRISLDLQEEFSISHSCRISVMNKVLTAGPTQNGE